MKYERVYFFVEAQWAIKNIVNQRLKVCRFLDLNDPFELFAGEQRDKILRKRMRNWAREINRDDGLLCFSESWRSPLMWSHYGDRHKGMCLGFDVDANILETINYLAKRPVVKGLDLADPPKWWRRMVLTTKFSRWKYEKERRVVLPLMNLQEEEKRFFKSFDDKLKLVEVIAGPRCCVKWKPHIMNAVEKLQLKPNLIKARLAFKQFRVVKQKLDNSPQRGFESDTYWQECSCPKPELHDRPDREE
jgi:hypothetical protein